MLLTLSVETTGSSTAHCKNKSGPHTKFAPYTHHSATLQWGKFGVVCFVWSKFGVCIAAVVDLENQKRGFQRSMINAYSAKIKDC
jgi:hypothetical protein